MCSPGHRRSSHDGMVLESSVGVHKVLKFQRENFQFVHCGHYTGAAA